MEYSKFLTALFRPWFSQLPWRSDADADADAAARL
jgi:hypothetical protein